MDSQDHPAECIISLIEAPATLAAEADAALVECALKIDVSIPASFKANFSHLAIVAEDTGLKGFLVDKKSSSEWYSPLFILLQSCHRTEALVLWKMKIIHHPRGLTSSPHLHQAWDSEFNTSFLEDPVFQIQGP